MRQFLLKLKSAPAATLILLGLLGFLPLVLLRPHQQLFGILAIAPIINLAYIGAGIVLVGRNYFNLTPMSSKIYQRFKQAIGMLFALLAIGGFVSLPLWPGLWLNSMTNTLTSDILYALIAGYFLYQGFWISDDVIIKDPGSLVSQDK